MFGTIQVRPTRPEHIFESAWGYAVGAARACMENAAHWSVCADKYHNPFDLSIANSYRDLADESRRRAYSLMLAFRWAFECNRGVEVQAALKTVKGGKAKFWDGSCAGETCLDCELPLWHHIVVMGRGAMCPFGREFWNLARAIESEMDKQYSGAHGVIVRQIAKR